MGIGFSLWGWWWRRTRLCRSSSVVSSGCWTGRCWCTRFSRPTVLWRKRCKTGLRWGCPMVPKGRWQKRPIRFVSSGDSVLLWRRRGRKLYQSLTVIPKINSTNYYRWGGASGLCRQCGKQNRLYVFTRSGYGIELFRGGQMVSQDSRP